MQAFFAFGSTYLCILTEHSEDYSLLDVITLFYTKIFAMLTNFY